MEFKSRKSRKIDAREKTRPTVDNTEKPGEIGRMVDCFRLAKYVCLLNSHPGLLFASILVKLNQRVYGLNHLMITLSLKDTSETMLTQRPKTFTTIFIQ